jgi:sugar transferase (PEP-CTERM/EpsH1 system associated)
MLQEISRFADVTLFSLTHDDEEASHASDVPFATRVMTSAVPRMANYVRGAARLLTERPLTHSLLNAPDVKSRLATLVDSNRPDVVLAYCSGMAAFALQPPLAGLPFVLDMVDVDSRKWLAMGAQSRMPMAWVYQREARTLEAFECSAAVQAHAVLVVSEPEAAVLRAIAPGAQVSVIRNGVDVAAFAPPSPPAESADVVFAGVMDYAPNVDGVSWFADEIWPVVKAARTDARLVIVGANPPRALIDRATHDPSLLVTGRVEAVQPYLWQAAVSIAPLRLARGLQNKVLEALSAGLPVVATSAVCAGLPEGVEQGCVRADTAPAFAQAVLSVLNQTPAARRMTAAQSKIEARSWPHELRDVEAILTDAARPR